MNYNFSAAILCNLTCAVDSLTLRIDNYSFATVAYALDSPFAIDRYNVLITHIAFFTPCHLDTVGLMA